MTENQIPNEDLKAKLSAKLDQSVNTTEITETVVETPVKDTFISVTPALMAETIVETPVKDTFISETVQSQSSPVISDAFESLRMSLDAEPQNTPETSNILSSIKVDLSAIEISSGMTDLDIIANEKSIFDSKKVMQVVACQSSYSAEMSAMRNQEIQNINDLNVDTYNFKKRLYKTLWSHIETTSVGKMDFATWMKVTSYFDVETLLYGCYCQTFPYENKYGLRCPKCQARFDAVVNNNTLIETRGNDQEIYAKINEVVSNVKDPKELVANSYVHTTKRVMVDESKIVFDIHVPSVFDYLEGILGQVNEKYAEEFNSSLSLGLFVKQVLIPDVNTYKKTGKLSFIPVTDKAKIIELLSNLSYFDGIQLSEHINDFTERLRIGYSIQKVSCPSCAHDLGTIEMEMEDTLFIAIRTGRSVNKK